MKNVKDDHGKVQTSVQSTWNILYYSYFTALSLYIVIIIVSIMLRLHLMYNLFVWQTKEEIVRWEEGKKWQAKMEKMKNSLKEKERENESLSKQLTTLKELYARSVCKSYWTDNTAIFDLMYMTELLGSQSCSRQLWTFGSEWQWGTEVCKLQTIREANKMHTAELFIQHW